MDEIWGDSPPASAAHTLESYVSRLRTVFAGVGPRLVRQGAGYVLRLNGSTLDSQSFAALADEVLSAGATGDHERCIELARKALGFWRGPAFEDVALGQSARVEAERLDERRLRALEQRIEAELALGHEENIVGELRVLVSEHPYRERFIAQLMLALYRTGRHVDALDAYERMRSVLADVGLQPSAELQQLSGRIVRQEAELERPRRKPDDVVAPSARKRVGLVGVAVAAVMSLVLAMAATGSSPQPAKASEAKPNRARVALVLPRSSDIDDAMRRYHDGLRFYSSVRDSDVKVEPILRNVEERLLNGRFGLVVWVADDEMKAAQGLVKALPSTKFVFVDTSLQTLALQGVANASAIRFAVEQTAELVGYLSGLVPPLNGSRAARAEVIGVVGGFRTMQADRNLAGFKRGLDAARPGVKVLVDYADETTDRTRCEQLANSQIDRGADVVVAVAGRCGSGALAVAHVRGVWGVGDNDATPQESKVDGDVLARIEKKFEMAMDNAITRFLEGSLPRGRDLVLGLNDDYAVGLNTSWKAPELAVSKMVSRCTEIRSRTSVDAAP